MELFGINAFDIFGKNIFDLEDLLRLLFRFLINFAFAFAIIAEAGMSFLGLGTQPPTPSWGLMLAEARPYIQQSTWYPLVPGIVLTIVVLSVTIVGDRLREILDPHSN